MAAILRRAVFDFVFYRDPEHKFHNLAVDAAGWLFWDGEEPENENRWSFLHICSQMGLDPKKVRKRCTELTRADLKKLTYHLKDDE